MAKINTGICPSCGKERELAYFQLGVVKSTMCVFCLEKYLHNCIIPVCKKNNDTSDDNVPYEKKPLYIGGIANAE